MEPKMDNWNDGRLDELSRRTDAGFKEVKGEIKDLSQRTDKGFDEVKGDVKELRQEFNAKFDRLTTALIVVGGTLVAAVIGSGIFG